MTLANMLKLDMQHLLASCLNDTCRDQALTARVHRNRSNTLILLPLLGAQPT
jgi:hypothetical protein